MNKQQTLPRTTVWLLAGASAVFVVLFVESLLRDGPPDWSSLSGVVLMGLAVVSMRARPEQTRLQQGISVAAVVHVAVTIVLMFS